MGIFAVFLSGGAAADGAATDSIVVMPTRLTSNAKAYTLFSNIIAVLLVSGSSAASIMLFGHKSKSR